MTEREILAAEHALSLLDGAELMEARRLAATDPAFAAEVEAWAERLAPLFAEWAPVTPPDELWARIERAIDAGAVGGGAEVIQLRQRLTRWRAMAGLATALAAALAVVALLPLMRAPAPVPSAPAVQAPTMMASLALTGAPGAVSIAFVPASRQLMVDASALRRASDHDHQLWIIPAGTGAKPISLGVVHGGTHLRSAMPAAMAAHFVTGATLALSVEPVGGSPTGLPTGPVIATGPLQII